MNNKIILATSGAADAGNLLNSINELIVDTSPLVVEAPIFNGHSFNGLPDARTMQEVKDFAFQNALEFQKTCVKRHIRFAQRPHFDNYLTKDLIQDSRFADLIVCTFSFLADGDRPFLKAGVRATIQKLECPLLVLPDNQQNLMSQDIFLFDGTPGSIQALKTFTYLFAHRCNNEIMIFNDTTNSVDSSELTSWLSAHYYRFRWIKQLPATGRFNFICGLSGKITFDNPVFIYHT